MQRKGSNVIPSEMENYFESELQNQVMNDRSNSIDIMMGHEQ